MNFSTNQVRHFYLLKTKKTSIGDLANPGDYFIKTFNIENQRVCEVFYVNATGEITHTDFIPSKQVRKATVTSADSMAIKMYQYKIKFNTFTPETGEVSRMMYLNFEFPAFATLSEEETYNRTIQFAGDSSSAANTATNCADAINKAFGTGFAKNKFVTAEVDASYTDTVIITAIMPRRHAETRGMFELRPTVFYISNFTQEAIMDDFVKRLETPYAVEDTNGTLAAGEWANTTNDSGNTNVLENGAIIADLEYFCMGDRADNYRKVGYPNFVPTSYMVDETKKYDTLDVHYYFQGEGTNDDKSEKVITFAVEYSNGGVNRALSELKDSIFNTTTNTIVISKGSKSGTGSGTLVQPVTFDTEDKYYAYPGEKLVYKVTGAADTDTIQWKNVTTDISGATEATYTHTVTEAATINVTVTAGA